MVSNCVPQEKTEMVNLTFSKFVTFFIFWCFVSPSVEGGSFFGDHFQETVIFQERQFSLAESPENRKCLFLQKEHDDDSLPLVTSSYEFSLTKDDFCVSKDNEDNNDNKDIKDKKDDNRNSCLPRVEVGADGEKTTIFFKWLLGLRLPRGVKSVHFVVVEDPRTCRPVGPTGLQLQIQILSSEASKKSEENKSVSNSFLENSKWVQEITLKLSQTICSNIGESLCLREFVFSNKSKQASKRDLEGENKENLKWEGENSLSTILWLPYPLNSLLLTTQLTFEIGKQGGRKLKQGEAIGLWHPSSSKSWKKIVEGWPSLFTLEGFNREVYEENNDDFVIPLEKKLRQRAFSLNSSLYSWKRAGSSEELNSRALHYFWLSVFIVYV